MTLDISKPLHGQVIDYSELKNLPKRINYLEKNEVKIIDKIIENREPLLFQPTSLTEESLPELSNKNDESNKYKKWYYKIILFGIFPDGRSVTLVLTGIEPYIYVKIPDKYQNSTGKRYRFKSKIEDMMKQNKENSKQKKGIDYERVEITEKKEFMGFNKKAYFLKIIFSKAGSSYSPRNRAIRLFNKNQWKTYSDDKSSHYKIPIRDLKLTVSSWITIKNYDVITNNSHFKDKDIYVVNISNIQVCDIKTIRNYVLDKNTHALSKDKTMIVGWDIECVSKSGDLPVPENLDDKLFMICLDFQWYFSKNQILKINLVDHPVSPHPDFISVICHNEKKILKAFSYMFNIMTPEYVVGFNDSGFDWPWIAGKAWIHSKKKFEDEYMEKSLIEYMAKNMDRLYSRKHHYYRNNTFSKWKKGLSNDRDFIYYTTGDKLKTINNAYISHIISNYKREKIKIDSETYHYAFFLQYNGYVAFDVRTIFRQIYPTAEKTSLNYFLTINNLKLKEDMDIQEMFRIYWRMDSFMNKYKSEINDFNDISKSSLSKDNRIKFSKLKDDMRKVSYYCIIDSQRCPELVKKRNIISDKKEVAKLTYSSIYDSYYRANGIKIRNMLFPILQDRGFISSNLSQKKYDDDKYPGALVLNPKTGLYVAKLTLEERIKKYDDFVEEFGNDFNEPYSLRDTPYKNLMMITDLAKKIECLKEAISELNSPAVSLSKEDAEKVNELAKKKYAAAR